MLKIDPAVYTGVTVLPSVIAEKHLLMASLPQLKVIIHVFHTPASGITPEGVAAACGMSAGDAADALDYWKSLGVLCEDVTLQAGKEEKEKETEKVSEKAPVRPTVRETPEKYTHDMIICRTMESPGVAYMFNEAQAKLGRTIGENDQSSLLLLLDYYGLPAEVILMVCEYARTQGKANNMGYIFTMGKDWSRREIDTLERADEELKRLESANGAWGEFARLAHLRSTVPTEKQKRLMTQWAQEWHFPMAMIVSAYEEMLNAIPEKPSFDYMHRILGNWHKAGIETPEQAEEEKKKFREKQEKLAGTSGSSAYNARVKPQDDGSSASYDIKRAETMANTQVPVLKKREKR